MKIIVCDYCGGHEAPYAELIYVGDVTETVSEICQGCVGRLKEASQLVKLPDITAEVASIDVLHRINRRLDELMVKLK